VAELIQTVTRDRAGDIFISGLTDVYYRILFWRFYVIVCIFYHYYFINIIIIIIIIMILSSLLISNFLLVLI